MYPAHAKINLGLRVLRRRPDGYHDIATIFHRLSLHDDLALEPAEDLRLSTDAADVPRDERNLCLRAARLLHQALGVTSGVHIRLTKRIPVGAGLGGGSSDAATVLTALPRFWNVEADREMLKDLALRIGSDVPYFLSRGSALARGRGEVLEHFELEIPYAILLCNPGIYVSTAWAYARVTPREEIAGADLREILLRGIADPAFLREHLRNDFEEPVIDAHPEIGKLKQSMLRAGAIYSAMSGSGSSVYAFFESDRAAREAAGRLSQGGALVSVTPAGFRA